MESNADEALWIFRTAEVYALAVNALLKHSNLGMPVLALPAAMLAALSTELYLKCLLFIETGQYPTRHNLKYLFEQLSKITRTALRNDHDTAIRTSPELVDMLADDLDSLLNTGQDLFTDLRYVHELVSRETNDDSVFPLLLFSRCVRERILDLRAEWISDGPTSPTP